MNSNRSKAFLLSIKTPQNTREQVQYSLEELNMLADTARLQVVSTYIQTRTKPDYKRYIGKGKLEEISIDISKHKPDTLIVDDELTPSQQKNLENFVKDKSGIKDVQVIDRTELILYIFSQRAHTKEAKLQVELAAMEYELPRLTRMWTHLNRQVGKIGTRGPGETQIEVDRRRLRDRITTLSNKIDKIQKQRKVQRKRRNKNSVPVGAIIGYTNAGKSTLLNKLTRADVLSEDKLFATLDTTSRKLKLIGNQEVILVDTVGFINKLPHNLVSSFRATLEEVKEADFYIHIVDISAPDPELLINSVYQVLEEINAKNKPVITLFNKIDKSHSKSLLHKLHKEFYPSLAVSLVKNIGIDNIIYLIEDFLSNYRTTFTLLIPFDKMSIVNTLHKQATVIEENYRKDGIYMEVEVAAKDEYLINSYVCDEDID